MEEQFIQQMHYHHLIFRVIYSKIIKHSTEEQFIKCLKVIYYIKKLLIIGVEAASKPYTPSMYMEGDQFIRNEAIRNGGGMYLDWDSLYIQNGVFTYNKANNGGGIYFVFLGKNIKLHKKLIH